MTADLAADAEWVQIFQDRRRTLPFRLGLCTVAAACIGPFTDLRMVALWLTLFVAIQLTEWRLGPVTHQRRIGFLLLLLSNTVVAAPAIFDVTAFGAWGSAVSVALVAGILAIGVAGARSAPLAFAASAIPSAAYLTAIPLFALSVGAAPRDVFLMAINGPLLLTAAYVGWRAQAGALLGEAKAARGPSAPTPPSPPLSPWSAMNCARRSPPCWPVWRRPRAPPPWTTPPTICGWWTTPAG
ncbi:hypothetical protein [Phenylobacterium aquaticum]|uniref:hypothetical protein n=1 Tax=Phenylobacterium aquaticum TaxID=1763816 RepID=UPI001F5D4D63|nr:hypothetical protein [Phenylobacterium aquaticum]MCI3134034.1 hypothetical protein [Phenylobacterium aquaticum]